MSLFDLASRVGRVVLASGSPRRAELLREAGFDPVIKPQDVDETPLPGEAGKALVERLARLKTGSALTQARPGDLVVAADTTVCVGGTNLGKPVDEEDARHMLRQLSGTTHQVSTGVCLAIAGEPRALCSFVETTDVTFYELASTDIDAYVASGEPADKAGAYAIQGAGRALIRTIDGDYFNVVGLPVARTLRSVAALAVVGEGSR